MSYVCAVLATALLLALVVIAALIVQLFEMARRYEQTARAVYEHHPLIDPGIDLCRIAFDGLALVAIVRADAAPGKVLFFACVGSIRAVAPQLFQADDHRRESLECRMLTPTMFEIDLHGKPGEFSLGIYPLFPGIEVRIASIEWREPHPCS